MAYTRFTPGGGGPLVIVAHGFSGSRGWMTGWGAHLASWGLDVVVPDLCHSTVFDADHERNGLDLIELAAEIGGEALYVGHSAGGLSAYVAGAADPLALGHLGLDTVESSGVGAEYAPIAAPAALVAGEPSTCNTQGNSLSLYTHVDVLRVTEADHCDFTSPEQALCTFGCPEGGDEAWIDPAIVSLTTSWLRWRAGLDAAAAGWWTPGEAGYESLVGPGFVVPL
jgi:pimeloyl-ACP methyl ester carboxylesterase